MLNKRGKRPRRKSAPQIVVELEKERPQCELAPRAVVVLGFMGGGWR